MKKNYLLIFLLLLLCSNLTTQAQISVSGATGVAATYPSLSLALVDIGTYSQAGNNIIITVTADYIETTSVKMRNSDWAHLTIQGDIRARSISFQPSQSGVYNNNLLEMNNASNITIKSLVIYGTYYVDGIVNKANTNATVYMNTGRNITIDNCSFSSGAGNRSVYTILGTDVHDVNITNCIFFNCFNYNTSDRLVSIIGASSSTTGTSKNWNISHNHFCETVKINFEVATARAFIYVAQNTDECDFNISNNYIGGSEMLAEGLFESEGSGGDLYGIMVLNSSATFNSAYSNTIQNNTIKNFNCTNSTNQIYSTTSLGHVVQERMAVFNGISTNSGRNTIKNNKIQNVNWKALSASYVSDGSSQYAKGYYTVSGITSVVEGVSEYFDCDDNYTHGLRLDILDHSGSTYGVIIFSGGIIASVKNGAKGVIQNNRIIWGYNSAGIISNQGADICGINASLSGGWGAQLDVHNNISVLEEANFYDESAWALNLIKLLTEYADEDIPNGNNGGRINCYNNIAFLQPKGASSFQKLIYGNNMVLGISVSLFGTSNPNTTNIFHNTVYMNEYTSGTAMLGNSTVSAGLGVQLFGGAGSVDVWNNLIVNRDDQGLVLFVNDHNTSKEITNFNFDYNTYYNVSTSNFCLMQETDLYWYAGSSVIGNFRPSIFNDWQFSNPSRNFSRESNIDWHSRYMDPLFQNIPNATITIDLSLADADALKNELNSLRVKLKPSEFLGGCKTPDNILSSININDALNVDFGAIDNSGIIQDNYTKRRTNMPTMGAINTSFSNYWYGTADSNWENTSNWGGNSLPAQDVIYAENVTYPLQVPTSGKTIRDYYNDTNIPLDLNGNKLTIQGYIGQEKSTGKNPQIKADQAGSTIVFNGDSPTLSQSRAQQIFTGTFVDNKVYNLEMNNQSDYFVLLHNELDILNDFTNRRLTDKSDFYYFMNTSSQTWYRGYERRHQGGLNSVRLNTTLKFSGLNTTQEIPRNIIFNDSVYNLTVNSNALVDNHDYLYVKNNLLINSDKHFKITAEKYLKVLGTSTNNAGVNGLLIGAEPDKMTATFLFNGTKLPATVQFWVKEKSTGNLSDEYGHTWQYFGPAVEQGKLNHWHGGFYVREHKETGSTDKNQFWYNITNDDDVFAGRGYEVSRIGDTQIVDFKGNILGYDFTRNFTSYSADQHYVGQHVLSNPYTAAIEVNNIVWSGSNVTKTIYVYNAGTHGDWESGGKGIGPQNNKGQYYAITPAVGGISGFPRFIPAMQGFVIQTTGAGGGVTFKYPFEDTHGYGQNDSKLRTPQKRMFTKMSLQKSDSIIIDQSWIFIDEGCSPAYENGYDAPKMLSDSKLSQLYSLEENSKYQINFKNNINDSYLAFKPEEDVKEYTLAFEHENLDMLYEKIILIDLVANTQIDITASGTKYNFTATNDDAAQTRFLIKSINADDTAYLNSNSRIDIYNENNTISISNLWDEPLDVQLFDVSGRTYSSFSVGSKSFKVTNTDFPNGIYIVKATCSQEDKSVKIIIK